MGSRWPLSMPVPHREKRERRARLGRSHRPSSRRRRRGRSTRRRRGRWWWSRPRGVEAARAVVVLCCATPRQPATSEIAASSPVRGDGAWPPGTDAIVSCQLVVRVRGLQAVSARRRRHRRRNGTRRYRPGLTSARASTTWPGKSAGCVTNVPLVLPVDDDVALGARHHFGVGGARHPCWSRPRRSRHHGR